MRITAIISGLWGGGAEHALCILASGWAERGHQLSILTFEHTDGQSYALHPAVQVRRLGLAAVSRHFLQALWRNVQRIRALRRAIRKSEPDIIISFMDQANVLTLLATRGLGRAVIIAEQTDPALYDIGVLWNCLRRLCYPLADSLVCPTTATLARFRRTTGVRGVAIANPIVVPSDVAQTRDRSGNSAGHTLIAMGRLVKQKGFDLLLEAFSRLADRHPDWSLTIIGKGPLQGTLRTQSEALHLGGRVHFAGELADPFPTLRRADLFVFPSRFEGFGMALAEAMACGLAVVSFDCPEGPRDIIRHGMDGVLVPPENVSALVAELDRLMGDAQERARLAARAVEAAARFNPDRILLMWEHLFNHLLTEGSSCKKSGAHSIASATQMNAQDLNNANYRSHSHL